MAGPLSDLFASNADSNDDALPASSLEGGDATQEDSVDGDFDTADSDGGADAGFTTFALQPGGSGDAGGPSDDWLEPQDGDTAMGL